MCSCQQHSNSASETVATPSPVGLNFRVDDMTCGHCAGTQSTAQPAYTPGLCNGRVELGGTMHSWAPLPQLGQTTAPKSGAIISQSTHANAPRIGRLVVTIPNALAAAPCG